MTPRPPLPFTKMHGLGNDFVVLDATRAPLDLSTADLRFLGDRRFGIGADQILVVEPARAADADFRYRIFNGATGEEVEHCGNGARCFLRYVRDHGLTDRDMVRVETMNNRIVLEMTPDGRVTVDMNQPVFAPAQIPFDPSGLVPRKLNGFELWPLANAADPAQVVEIAAVSMGNPHAVQRVEDVDTAPVATVGPWVEAHASFARKVNAGFLQVVDRGHVRLRVYERGAGETLACGTGACAAVVAGIRLGWLDPVVDVETRGGRLTIAWDGLGHSVRMTGPAVTVFEGTVAFPD
ncbi:diaminopimelate epimerase [Sphaerotilus sp.]|uniref:diaminopimelate epimerase n=1 Tax=Sphaerotilus sp. TaxID=2093942 RepID=UPI002ACD6415|nr:diaminopimelate epimerase [Sphaerotilus sp.]MDZ7858906.1 diaminopimelate epimerase [Sphaerotilus sp.]